jgi:hypothetical protein
MLLQAAVETNNMSIFQILMAMTYSEDGSSTFISIICKFPADYSVRQVLTFKWPGWYLNFCALFTKNII